MRNSLENNLKDIKWDNINSNKTNNTTDHWPKARRHRIRPRIRELLSFIRSSSNLRSYKFKADFQSCNFSLQTSSLAY